MDHSGFGADLINTQSLSQSSLRPGRRSRSIGNELRPVKGNLVLAFIYAGSAIVGLQFAIPPGNASAVWPPSGIAVGALLIYSRSLAPGVWLGAFAAASHTGIGAPVAAAIATGNASAAILAAEILSRLVSLERPFRSVRDAFHWMVVAAVASVVSAASGVFSLYASGIVTEANLEANFCTWWLGDVTGIMLIGPAVVLFGSTDSIRPGLPGIARLAECIAVFLVLALVSAGIFCGWLTEQVAEGILYLPIIVLVWLLLRFGMACVVIGNLTIAIIAVWGTSLNVGAFATEAVHQSLFDLQFFLTTYSLTGLALTGMLMSSRDAEHQHAEAIGRFEATRTQIQLAHDIQVGLFPETVLETETAVCAGICRPAAHASGDYFDYLQEPDGSIVFMIGDVSGHGVGPALMMAETRAYARALLQSDANLETLIQKLNTFLFQDTIDGHFVTFMICRYSPASQAVTYIGAGHDGTLVRAGDVRSEKLRAVTLPLGLCPELSSSEVHSLDVSPGDSVVLFTDGITEVRSAEGEMFGMDRLTASLHSHVDLGSPKIIEVVLDDVRQFAANDGFTDDQTIVVMKVK